MDPDSPFSSVYRHARKVEKMNKNRFRCARCKKITRGKVKRENAVRYYPYCSFHCSEWARLENASQFVRDLPEYLK